MIKPPPQAASPFAARCAFYVDKGLVIVPIAPGTKRPGAFSGGKWHGMKDWSKYVKVSPTGWQTDEWSRWPDAGIGLLCGKLSGVIAIDIDTDDPTLIEQIQRVAGPSPVRKKGRKGYTAFYRFSGEIPASWDVNKQRVVDLLSDGRQTLMPGTQHPDGMTYVYTTEDTLEEFDMRLLPALSKTFNADLDALLAPMQTPEDKAARREKSAEPLDDTRTEIFQSIAAQMWKTINQTALDRLDDWVPDMIAGAKPDGKGYRCRAYWRNAENPNVGIHHTGIRDFGQGVGLTPIDLVMFATNSTFDAAQRALSHRLGLDQGNRISITVNQREPLAKPRPDEPTVDLSKLMASKPRAATPDEAVKGVPFDPLAAAIKKKEEERVEAEKAQDSLLPEFVANAPGLIGAIADWVNATAPKTQPEFAVVTALTIGATVMGRRYVTQRDNYSSMFYLIMARTGEGKDHPQKCVRKLLDKAGLSHMIGGSGYTSAGAVFTALIRQPSHVTIIDEFGQYIKSLGKAGSQVQDSAMVKLMEVITNGNSSVRPQGYSAMSQSKKDIASNDDDRTVHNPAITLMCATTPGVFFGALQEDQLEGGMLNRFIMVQTNQPIRVGQKPQRIDPPDGALAWCKEVTEEFSSTGDLRDSNINDPSIPSNPIMMEIEPEADTLWCAFEQEIVDRRNQVDETLGALIVRSPEKALRVAMVVAKMTNAPRDNLIRADAMSWAIKYVRHYDYRMATAVETQRPQSKIEGRLAEVERILKRTKTYRDAAYLKVTQVGAMPHALLLKKLKVDSREMTLIMQTAVESGLVFKQAGVPEVGFAGDVYYLRGAPD